MAECRTQIPPSEDAMPPGGPLPAPKAARLPDWVLSVICVLVIGFGLFLSFGLSDFDHPGRAGFYA